MQRFSQGYFDSVTRAVEEAETNTPAEVVVAIRPQSGRYADADYLFGGLVALAGLLFIVFNPWTWHPAYLLPVEMVVLFVIGTLGCSVCPPLRRRLTTGKRRHRQLHEAAADRIRVAGLRSSVSDSHIARTAANAVVSGKSSCWAMPAVALPRRLH